MKLLQLETDEAEMLSAAIATLTGYPKCGVAVGSGPHPYIASTYEEEQIRRLAGYPPSWVDLPRLPHCLKKTVVIDDEPVEVDDTENPDRVLGVHEVHEVAILGSAVLIRQEIKDALAAASSDGVPVKVKPRP